MTTDLEHDLAVLGRFLRASVEPIGVGDLTRPVGELESPATMTDTDTDIVGSPPIVTGPPERGPSRGRRRLVAVSALAVAATLAALVALPDRGGVRGPSAPATTADSEVSTDGPGTTSGAATSAPPATTTPSAGPARYTGWYFPGHVPDGYEVTSIAASAAADAVTMQVTLLASEGAAGGFVSFTSSPNGEGQTLETLEQQVAPGYRPTTRIERVGERDRLVGRRPADRYGPFTEITWIEDGLVMSVTGRAPADDMLRFAASVAPVDPERVGAEGRAITDRLLARPVLDRATLADGTVVSVRTLGRGPVALCVEAPVRRCRWDVAESALGGQAQAGVVGLFAIEGRTVLLGWHAGAQEPTVQPDAADTGSAAAPVAATEIVRAATGTVVEVVVPEGGRPPALAYGAVTHGVGMRLGTTVLDF